MRADIVKKLSQGMVQKMKVESEEYRKPDILAVTFKV